MRRFAPERKESDLKDERATGGINGTMGRGKSGECQFMQSRVSNDRCSETFQERKRRRSGRSGGIQVKRVTVLLVRAWWVAGITRDGGGGGGGD